jgi:hypothetical protein
MKDRDHARSHAPGRHRTPHPWRSRVERALSVPVQFVVADRGARSAQWPRRYGPPTESPVLAHGTAPVDVGGRSAGWACTVAVAFRVRVFSALPVAVTVQAAGHIYGSEIMALLALVVLIR